MSDRELREMAAKAAGIEVHVAKGGGSWRNDGSKIWPKWNPLTDDGDALRLAVSIPGLNLQWIIAEAWQAHEDQASRMKYVRGAITRAAAEIGRAMSPQ